MYILLDSKPICLYALQRVVAKGSDDRKNTKSQKGLGMSKNGKPSVTKAAPGSASKKNKDKKDGDAISVVSNGSVSSSVQTRNPTASRPATENKVLVSTSEVDLTLLIIYIC